MLAQHENLIGLKMFLLPNSTRILLYKITFSTFKEQDVRNYLGKALAIAIIALGVSFSTAAQCNGNLPYPQAPATMEQMGCVKIDENMKFILGAVSMNEGLMVVGSHGMMQTVTDGYFTYRFLYDPKDDFAYVLANKGAGEMCVIEKLHDVEFQSVGKFEQVSYAVDKTYSTQECSITKNKIGEICFSFKKVSKALKGFRIDYQGALKNGDIVTVMSGKGKSYKLLTYHLTRATVVVGVAKEEFTFNEIPNKNPSSKPY